MLRITLPTLLALSIIGCSSKEEEEDSGDYGWVENGSGGWGSGATGWGGGSGSTGGSAGGSTSDGGSNTDGSGGGSEVGGSSGTTGGGSGGGSGGGTSGGGASGGGSGGDGVAARDYAGGYITNRCATTPTATGTNVGDISPDWELVDQYGESVRLSDFCGSLVLLESAGFS